MNITVSKKSGHFLNKTSVTRYAEPRALSLAQEGNAILLVEEQIVD